MGLQGVFPSIAIAILAGPAQAGERPVSWIANGGFERGTDPWGISGSAVLDESARAGGSRSLRIRGGGVHQDLSDLPPGSTLTIAASFRTEDVAPEAGAERGYAYLAVYQIDELGDLAAFRDFVQAAGMKDWSRASFTFTVEPETSLVSVRAGLYRATGTLWIDDLTLVEGGAPADFDPAREADSAPIPGFEPGPRGNVAILDEAFPPLPREGPGAGHASSPERLAATLRAAGFGVGRINAGGFADRRILDRSRFDALLLPSGPQFPASAARSLRRFLKAGGKLVTLGGYAFDSLLEKGPAGWRPSTPPAARGPGDARWHCEIPSAGLRGRGPLTFSAWTRTLAVSGEMFAFLAVYQYAADGRLVTFHDLCQLRGTRGWERQAFTFQPEPATERVDLMAGILSARGAVWFDELVLTDGSGKEVLPDLTESDFDPDLRAGGKWWRSDRDLLTIDGTVAHAGKRTLKAKLRGAPEEVRLNTRHGRPGDGLSVEADQLGMFDPDFPLERAARAEAAPGQPVFPPDFRLEGPLRGWAATGVTGGNAARWTPLLLTFDRYGRPRGAAGAMLRFYGGPFRGSSWAFFGLTDRDPFEGPGGERALARLLEILARDVSIAWVKADPPCVRPGEAVRLQALARNGSREARKVLVSIEAAPPGAAAPSFRGERTLEIAAGAQAEVTLEWRPERWPSDFIALRASVRLPEEGSASPEAVDSIEGGLVAWNDALVRSSPPLTFKDNYLRLGGRPLVLFGTDDYGHVFTSDREGPLEWLHDAVKRRDFGINIYENLQVGYIHEKLDKVPEGLSARERFFRKCDGLVQIVQAHGQVYFPCLLCGYDVAVDDGTLEAHAGFALEYARRYKDVPGLIYYLNGDLRCRITAAVKPQWNAFLRERYGSTAALRAAWGPLALAEELGEVPAEDYLDRGRAWDDVKAYDYNRFRAWLIRRWTGRLIRAIREVDPVHPTTCEFYQLPHEGVDVPAAIGGLDLSNIGYFDRPGADIRRFPTVLALSDQRARGKSLGPGEYGVKTHPAWGDGRDHGYHTARSGAQAIDLFLAVAHYTLGLGGSRLHNWCWKDGAEWIFPWGLVRSLGGVEKDTLRVLRNQSLLFRHLAPVYRPPAVYLLTPDSHRLGGAKWEVTEGILEAISLLQSAHAEMGVLNEDSLVPERSEGGSASGIPPEARALFYPIPFTPPDAAYQAVLEFVKRGGVLYLSGDISFDELRKRTRIERLLELCGVRFRSAVYEGISAGKDHEKRITRQKPDPGAAPPAGGPPAWTGAPCISVEPAGAEPIAWTLDGAPVAFKNRVGKGWVVYGLDPQELRPAPEARPFHRELYREVLALAGAPPLEMSPDSPEIHLFRVPLQDGGRALVLYNTAESGKAARMVLGGEPAITLEVAPRRPALVWLDGEKRVRAVEALSAMMGGQTVLSDSTGGSALSLDGADLRRSRALLLMPLEPGRVRLTHGDPLQGEVGEISEGRWRAFEPARVERAEGEIRIEVTADQAGSLILLAGPGALEEAKALLERAVLHPELLD